MKKRDWKTYMRIRRTNNDLRTIDNEKTKEYQKTFHGRMALRVASVNTTSRNRDPACGKITKDVLLSIWNFQGGLAVNGIIKKEPMCAMCGKELDTFGYRGFFIDHKVPITFGGKNSYDNLHLLCDDCNREKTKKDVSHRRDRSQKYNFNTITRDLQTVDVTLFKKQPKQLSIFEIPYQLKLF